jgi:hypothetical protein
MPWCFFQNILVEARPFLAARICTISVKIRAVSVAKRDQSGQRQQGLLRARPSNGSIPVFSFFFMCWPRQETKTTYKYVYFETNNTQMFVFCKQIDWSKKNINAFRCSAASACLFATHKMFDARYVSIYVFLGLFPCS